MADLSITVSNSIRTFGPAPSTKWGSGSPYTMTWGASKWGEGTQDIPVDINVKLVENSLAPTWDMAGADATRKTENTVSPTFDATQEDLTDGSGYHYNFPNDTSNPTSMAVNTWTAQSDGATVWTKQSDGSTSWGES